MGIMKRLAEKKGKNFGAETPKATPLGATITGKKAARPLKFKLVETGDLFGDLQPSAPKICK